MKLSARNQIPGKIVQVRKGQTTSHVQIDVGHGVIVTASITNEAVDDCYRSPARSVPLTIPDLISALQPIIVCSGVVSGLSHSACASSSLLGTGCDGLACGAAKTDTGTSVRAKPTIKLRMRLFRSTPASDAFAPLSCFVSSATPPPRLACLGY